MTLAVRHSTAAAAAADARATELVNTMAALPLGHPDRPRLRGQAIEAWMPMAKRLTRRYANRGESFDDLLQTAAIGLIKAVDGFDATRGVDFVGYAIPTILGEIKRYFRDKAWTLRIPRRLQELRLAIAAAQADLSHDLQQAPTVADVAGRLGVSEEEVLEAMEAGHAYRAVSLSAPLGDGEDSAISDTLAAEEAGYARAELNVALPPALASLDNRERRIVVQYFYGNQTQACIAEQLGISQMHVSRLLSRALKNLRGQLSEAG
ncbi:SigB/SigF/SigG family RNA polymerase sigma factor [Actinoplanes sp. NPDC051470]|uniref:SigB/SigF/SigG family RNA polymerase sigma factor n=1 Tax=Actinoplanes sp. NPDC051470 TaxID=3157224 RepID=UPI003440DE95